MKQLKLNIIANLIGRGWMALLSLALVPVYIKLIGIESYALVGIYTTLYSLFSLLDVGLSSTLSRELARLSVQESDPARARNLVRTLEIIYWLISGFIAVALLLLAPLIATHWLQAEKLSTASIQQSLLLISIVIAAQFPFILYTGGLQGLQRQVLLNGLIIAMATLRSGGAVLVLWLVSPTVQAFFSWQLLVSLLQTVLSGFLLWRNLPKASTKPRFQKTLLKDIWKFAAGLTAVAFLGLLLNNLDKIILSNVLSLEAFGYYSVATTVATSLYMIVVPIYNAAFPQLSQLVALGDEEALKKSYHRSCQVMAVLIIPIGLFIALFAPEILRVWTGNALVVENAHLPLSLLIIGTTFNGLMNVPYALILAYGWMKFPFYQNLVAVGLIVPLLIIAAGNYGMVGAAATWVLLNLGYILIGVQVMHRRLLRTEKRHWYVQDVGIPLLTTLVIALLGRWLLPSQAPGFIVIPGLGLIMALTLAGAFWVTPGTGGWLRYKLLTFRKKVSL